MKKLITLLLTICMVMTLTPAVSFAVESVDQPDSGQVVRAEDTVDSVQAAEAESQAYAAPEAAEAQETAEPQSADPQGQTVEDPDADATNDDGGSGLSTADDPPSIGWVSEDNHWKYKIGESSYVTGTMQQIGAAYYLFDAVGFMMTGLQTFENRVYFFNTNGSDPRFDSLGAELNGWINLPDRGMCYFDPNERGAMSVGRKAIGANTYYFGANGAMQVNCFIDDGGNRYYFGSNGVMKTGWLTLSNDKYYFGSDGAMRTGWQTVSGDKYYFDPSSGKAVKGGPVQIGKSKYYFNSSNGKMVKGWQTINGARYFFSTSNGTMQTGWLTHNGKKYYLKSNGAAKIGLATINGNRYYFQSDASMMKNAAVKVKGKLYYFLKSGKGYKKKGWFKGSDGGKRYSLGKGRVQTGKKKIKGIWYQFNKYTGIAKTIGDSFDNSIQSKTSQTKYLITVNRAKYEVRVYQGKKNNWTRVKTMSCGVGAPATPTPAGTFVTTNRLQVNAYTLDGTKVRYWYHTQFQSEGNKGIHSGLYYVDTGEPYDTALKTQNSQGSVRVDLNNAEWIFYNVPLNTTVYIK